MTITTKPAITPTPKITPAELAGFQAAARRASLHRAELEAAGTCACYFCFKKFATGTIKTWVDGNQTALCPHCGLDAVLGGGDGLRIDDRFLRRLHQHYFASRSSKPR
jgi:hypothetical protein